VFIIQFDAKHRVRQGLDHAALDFNPIFFRHNTFVFCWARPCEKGANSQLAPRG
jgi:hypothetical protein